MTDDIAAEVARVIREEVWAYDGDTYPLEGVESAAGAIAALIREKVEREREACAKVAGDDIPRIPHDGPSSLVEEAIYMTAGNIAAAIRARKEASDE